MMRLGSCRGEIILHLLHQYSTRFYRSDSRMLPFIHDRLVATIAKKFRRPAIPGSLVSAT
jgi:hypothetical protein